MKQFLTFVLLTGLSSALLAEQTRSIDDFRAAADKANAILTIPEWPNAGRHRHHDEGRDCESERRPRYHWQAGPEEGYDAGYYGYAWADAIAAGHGNRFRKG